MRFFIFIIFFCFLPLFPISADMVGDINYPLEAHIGGYAVAKNLIDYISHIYDFALGIVGILATVVIIYGGVRWASAAGNESSITAAKEAIIGALVGLIIAVGSYTILNFINPQLIAMNSLAIQKIPPPEIKGCGSECRSDVDCSQCNYGDATCFTLVGMTKVCRANGICGGYCTVAASDCTECQSDNPTKAVDCLYNICTVMASDQPLNAQCSINDEDGCAEGLTCVDTTGLTVGTCSDGSEDSFCDRSEEGSQGNCDDGLVCAKTSGGQDLYKCVSSGTDKPAGDTCADNDECASGICMRNECSEGTDYDQCDEERSDDCAEGYTCIDMGNYDYICSSGEENSPCLSNDVCDDGYFCGTAEHSPSGEGLNVCIAEISAGGECGWEGVDEDDFEDECADGLSCDDGTLTGDTCPCTCQ